MGSDPTNTNDVYLENQGATTILNLSRGGSAAGTVAGVVQDDNVGSPTVATAGTITLVAGNPPTPLLFAPGGVEAIEAPIQTSAGQRAVAPASVGDANPPAGFPVASDTPASLSQAQLDSVASAALVRWTATGLTGDQIATLRGLKFEVADLPGWYLGSAGDGMVTLDMNAAGNQWFIDRTPLDDREFGTHSNDSRLYASPISGSNGRIDLLTTVMHEIGHQLGLEDSYMPAARNSLMYGYLTLGERRLPTLGQAIGADPLAHHGDAGPEFLFTPINIGTLTFGTTIRLQFRATVANPLVGTGSVSNQGSVSGSNFATVNTDDPDVAGTQATVTLVQPATPAAPDLQAASDTGLLATDNITNAANPVFDVGGVDAAATVELLRGGVVVASRTGPGTLTDTAAPTGTNAYTVRHRFGAGGINSDVSAGLSVTIDRTSPASPALIDLQSASDSGPNNSDNTTNVATPTFDVVAAADPTDTEQLLRDGSVVATRTGAGSIQDPGPITNGGHAYTARLVDLAGNVGNPSSTLNVVLDTVAPTLTGTPVFQFETGLSILYSFSELLTSTFTVGSVVVNDLTTPGVVPAAVKSVTFLNTDIRLSFSSLVDADYSAVIAPGSLTDLAGNAFVAGNTLAFYWLAGDFNRDRSVNFADLVILAQNYGLSPKTFSQGDANFDNTVNFGDLVILSQNYNKTLAPALGLVTVDPKTKLSRRAIDGIF